MAFFGLGEDSSILGTWNAWWVFLQGGPQSHQLQVGAKIVPLIILVNKNPLISIYETIYRGYKL